MPASTSSSAFFTNASKSGVRSSLQGVMIAGRQPLKIAVSIVCQNQLLNLRVTNQQLFELLPFQCKLQFEWNLYRQAICSQKITTQL